MLILNSTPLHPFPTCISWHPHICSQQTVTHWRTQTHHAYSCEHLELESIGSQTTTLAADQSRRRQISAITAIAIIGMPCLMKPSPSQIYHSDFENESLALSTSTAGCKKFRTKVKAMALMNKTNSGFPHSADGPWSHTRLIMHAAFLFYDLTLK